MRPTTHAALASAAAVAIAGVVPASQASATTDFVAINGTFAALSVGQYATTDYAFRELPSVTSTWTITSQCATEVKCEGEVSSDQGWTAPLRMRSGNIWSVERDLPGWQVCPDGSRFPGTQTFTFFPADDKGVTKIGSPYLEGKDKTVGVNGACGQFYFVTVIMPFRLDKIG